MTHDDMEDQPSDAAVRHLNDLRQAFWDRVRAGDRAEAERIQGEVYEYWHRITGDLKGYPAVAATWSAARQDVELPLAFMDDGETPAGVWEARAEIERVGERLRALRSQVNPREETRDSLAGVGAVAEELTDYYAALDPGLQRHPILLKALSDANQGFVFLSGRPMPPLTEEERANLKRRRMYQWTATGKDILFLAELTPPSEKEGRGWLADFLATEQRIKELVEQAGERFVQLYWQIAEQHLALLLTFGVDSQRGARDVAETLAASELFTVERTTRVLTSEELWIANSRSFPTSDSFREEDLDEEELAAWRRYQRRQDEEKQAIIASTPCHVCGRFVDPSEQYSVNSVSKGCSIVAEDGTVIAEGPATLVYCAEHRS